MAVAKHFVVGLLSIVALLMGAAASSAQGLQFRVDTEIFKNDEKKPILEQLTIFADDGTVYGFILTSPPEVTVFDPRHGRFTLLDETRKVKAVVKTQELLDFTLDLQKHAANQRNALFAFCATPHFDTLATDIERQGQSMTELRLVGKPMSYTVLGVKPPEADAVKAYRHFADWCARLNSTRGGNLPSGARLELNRELAERGLLPFEIVRRIPASTPLGKDFDLKSEHRVNWALCGEDQRKMERAGDMMAKFEMVSYVDYCAPDSKPAAQVAKQASR
jgi:hypothetical protein